MHVGGPERQADRRERRLLGGVRVGARHRGRPSAFSRGVDHEHLVAHEHADLHEQQEQHHEHREDEGQLDRRLAPVTPGAESRDVLLDRREHGVEEVADLAGAASRCRPDADEQRDRGRAEQDERILGRRLAGVAEAPRADTTRDLLHER